jgi:hypothetical protein
MLESWSTLLDLFTRPDFQGGLVAGALGLVILLLISNEESPASWWGETFSVATLVAIGFVVGRRLGVTAGVAALAVGGWLLAPARATPVRALGGLMALAGAAVVAWRGGLSDISWLPPLTVIAIVIAGVTLSAWSDRLPHNVLGPMVAITAFGIWVTVPDTEHARVLLGVALPMAFATVSRARARMSTGGAWALAGTVVWIVALGGEARPASIIGGWSALGALAILPLVRPSAKALVRQRPVLVVGVHTVFVLIVSRVIGLWDSVVMAVIAVLFIAVGALVAAGMVSKRHILDERVGHGPE